MLTRAFSSIEANLRASTSASKIKGFSDNDVAATLNDLFRKKTDTAGCIKLMDNYRINRALTQGT